MMKYCVNENAKTDLAGMFYDVTMANILSMDHLRNNSAALLN
jgi:hypothetical protein